MPMIHMDGDDSCPWENAIAWHCGLPSGFMQEDDYIPHVKEFICLQKQFEKPYAAGNALARQQNKKPASKAKAKAKSKA